MKQKNTVLGIGTITALMLCIFSCNFQKSWPPKSPSSSPVEGFETSNSFSFNDWAHVYMNEEDANASNPMGMAYLIKEGNYELPFNLFSIPMAGPNYVESQFEVLYFDDKLTQVQVVEAEGDKVALIKESSSPETGMSTTYAFGFPGAKIRCGDQVYEIHADGWYHNGELVHAFE